MRNEKRYLVAIAAALLGSITVLNAQSFTDVNNANYWGVTDGKKLTAALDANFDKVGGTVGAVSTNGNTAAEYAGQVHMTTITLANAMTATDGSAEGETEVIYTFPAGRIYILGAAIDGTIVNNATAANTADTFDVAIGTAAAADDATLTSTEADIIASTTYSDGAVTLTNAWETDMTSGADTVFDGTSTAVTLNLNLGIADANITTNNFTATFTGTVNVFWVNLGDD